MAKMDETERRSVMSGKPRNREQFDSAMKCETEAEAAAWLKAEIEDYRDYFDKDAAEAEYTIKSNLGYMAGYYNHETAQKVRRLFGAVHPVFGTADYQETQTPKQCFDAGVAAVEALDSENKVNRGR